MSERQVLVAVAMPEEAAPFLTAASRVEALEHLGVPGLVGHRLTFGTRQVLMIRTGIGLVNAALGVTATLLRMPGISVVVSAGTAGGLAPQLRVGELVVVEAATYGAADARAFGYRIGQVPGMPEVYRADAHLVARARAVAGSEGPASCGLLLSSDVFVDAGEARRLRSQFPDALAVDMETTAIAQVAWRFGLPFLAVRGISDLCDPAAQGGHQDQVADAAAQSMRIVRGLLVGL